MPSECSALFIDAGCRRLLWITETRTVKSFTGFFNWLGKARSKALRVVCSGMWKPYLNVIHRRANQALNVLDKFHISPASTRPWTKRALKMPPSCVGRATT